MSQRAIRDEISTQKERTGGGIGAFGGTLIGEQAKGLVRKTTRERKPIGVAAYKFDRRERRGKGTGIAKERSGRTVGSSR